MIICAVVLAVVYRKSDHFIIDDSYDAIDQHGVSWTFYIRESKMYAINSMGLG